MVQIVTICEVFDSFLEGKVDFTVTSTGRSHSMLKSSQLIARGVITHKLLYNLLVYLVWRIKIMLIHLVG